MNISDLTSKNALTSKEELQKQVLRKYFQIANEKFGSMRGVFQGDMREAIKRGK